MKKNGTEVKSEAGDQREAMSCGWEAGTLFGETGFTAPRSEMKMDFDFGDGEYLWCKGWTFGSGEREDKWLSMEGRCTHLLDPCLPPVLQGFRTDILLTRTNQNRTCRHTYFVSSIAQVDQINENNPQLVRGLPPPLKSTSDVLRLKPGEKCVQHNNFLHGASDDSPSSRKRGRVTARSWIATLLWVWFARSNAFRKCMLMLC